MKLSILASLLSATLLALSPVAAQQQAAVAVFPFGALSKSDRWIADGLSRDLNEKLVRTPDLRPVDEAEIEKRLVSVLDKKSKGAAWLPQSAQRKVGEWVEADLIAIGIVGSSGNRDQARAYLDGLSIVPSVTPDGSEAWIAARLIDVHRGVTVSWAFAEGSRNGFFELQDAIYLQIIADLGIDPGSMPRGTIGRPTESASAYRLAHEAEDILRGTHETKHQPKQWQRAIRKLEKTLKLDPAYAKAYMLLGQGTERSGDLNRALAAYGQASALDPNYVAPRMAIADLAREAGDAQAELSALTSVLEAVPEYDVAYERMGAVYHRLGNLAEAASHYDRALVLADGRPDRLYRAGSIHLGLGQTAKAVAYLEQAVARTPGNVDYHVQLIRALTRAKRYSDGENALNTARQLGAESTDLWLAAGEMSMGQGDFTAAEQAFVRVLQQQPGRMDARLMVAKLRSMRGDHAAAVEAYEAAIREGILVEDVVDPLAQAYLGLGRTADADRLYQTALQSEPTRVDWLMARSRILIESLKQAEAIPLLRRVLAEDANNADALEWIAGAYATVGNEPEAIRHYIRLLKHAPDRSYAFVQLADLSYRVREYAAAKNAYERAIESGNVTADVYAGLGLAEEELRNYRSARSAYQKAVRTERNHEIALAGLQRMRTKIKVPKRPPTAAEWASRGRSLLGEGDLVRAVAAFERSVSQDDSNARVLNDLGTASARLGDVARSRWAFEQAESLEPSPESAYNLGRLSFEEGKTSEAKLNYQIALQRDETFTRAAMNLAALQIESNDISSAIKTLGDIRRHHSTNGAIAISLANAHFQAGELDRASEVYASARSLVGATSDAEIGLGNVALALGDTLAATEYYRSAIQTAPDNPDPYVNLGTVLIQQGLYDQAVNEFQKALELSPSDLALYLNLAVLYYHTEQYPEALEYCRAILEQDATMIEPQRLIGDIAIATEEYDLAVDAYGAVLKVAHNDLRALLSRADALVALEREEEAREHWQQWLDVAGDDPTYADQAKAVANRLEPESASWLPELPSSLW